MDFFNSPFFAGLATIVTGVVAIVVYLLQKRNEKINAAVAILFEIRNAESKADIISGKINNENLNDLPTMLPVNSWRKYSHLFAKDFDEDEFRALNSFYSDCEFIEDFINRQNGFFWISAEERAKVAQQVLAQIYLDYQKGSSVGDDAAKKTVKNIFDAQLKSVKSDYTNEPYFYIPNKTSQGLKYAIDHLQRLTATTCGTRLKKLAKV